MKALCRRKPAKNYLEALRDKSFTAFCFLFDYFKYYNASKVVWCIGPIQLSLFKDPHFKCL